jgi:aspartyl-tRNA synthetase
MFRRRLLSSSVVSRKWLLNDNRTDLVKRFPPVYRSIQCGFVSDKHVGQPVILAGWLRTIRNLGSCVFFVLGDESGRVQCVWTKELAEQAGMMANYEDSQNLAPESVVRIYGTVSERPSDQQSSTGNVEVQVESVLELNGIFAEDEERGTALPIPVEVTAGEEPDQEMRLRYRYLDMRRQSVLKGFKLRSDASLAVRKFLHDIGFTEVETPTLFKPTSEGAREFLVPTRREGFYYALSQSPQQFKQMLMSGGIDRYYQFARCYRDEDGRADRQPEFTQIDMELAFATKDEIMGITEDMVRDLFSKTIDVELPEEFTRMSYTQAMETYGSDKPDLRYPSFTIHNIRRTLLSGASQDDLDKSFSEANAVHALLVKKAGGLSRKDFDALKELLPNVLLVRLDKQGEWKLPNSLSHLFSEDTKAALKEQIPDLWPGDCLCVLAGSDKDKVLAQLGRHRTIAISFLQERRLVEPVEKFSCLWIDQFPLFELNDEGELSSAHHPFTAPDDRDMRYFQTNSYLSDKLLVKLRGQSFDLVINGMEVGGGSIRIHNPKLQLRILKEILKLNNEQISHFSHLLEALSYGCPPHGGIALGFDRLCAILTGNTSIREVIAFPKTNNGRDLLTNSPQFISSEKQ